MTKKFLAFVLTLCLMVSVTSTTSYASETSHSSGNGYYTSNGSYHHSAADGSYLVVGGKGPKITLTMSGNPNGYYRLYVTTPTGHEYQSTNTAYGGGGSVTMDMPSSIFLAPAGTYYFTIMLASGSTSGQTNYWTVTATW